MRQIIRKVTVCWCENEADTALDMLEPVVAYVEKLLKRDGLSKPTVKQHLAAIRMLFAWMVTSAILTLNSAPAVRGSKYVTKKAKRGADARGSPPAAGID